MNEWAARFLSVFPERNKADLDEFIQQVNNDQAEHMYFNKEFDAEVECRPTFEQLSHERIINEANKNINVLKALENVLTDRMAGYNTLHTTLTKAGSSHSLLENVDGTLKVALDSLFVFTEQETLQCKQHTYLSDLRKSLAEMRLDAQKRITDYQKEINAAEKEVTAAEKRLAKTKEALERSMDYKSKMESFELDIVLNNSRPVLGFGGASSSARQDSFSSRNSKDSNSSHGGSFNAGNSAAEEAITKVERELKEDIRFLLKAINHRDNVLSASRRAYQKLHRECKKAAQLTLLRIADKEQEQADQRAAVLAKLQQSVRAVDIEADENEFIESYSGREGALVLSAQALSLLGDLVQPPVPDTPLDSASHGAIKPGMYTYADMGAIDARSDGVRSESPLVRRTSSTDSAGNPQVRSPPHSPNVNKHGRQASSSSTAANNSTPGNKGSATASTPQTARFSFRRTLGLRTDSPPPPISTPVAPLPAPPSQHMVLPELPHYPHPPMSGGQHTNHHMPSYAVVAGGKVGGDSNAASAAALQADFTQFLTQIFYPPGASAEDRNSTTITKSALVKDLTVQTALTASEDSCGGESGGGESPRTPKVLIDDNYFRHPATPSDDTELESGRRTEKLPFAKSPPCAEESIAHKDLVDSPDTLLRKGQNRHVKVRKQDLHCGALEWLKSNPESYLIDAVEGISRAIKTQAGRDAFTSELNQFRSKKVEVGEGFCALGAVLWTTLSHCQAENDIHTASVIMMLSQTFYKKIVRESTKHAKKESNHSHNDQQSQSKNNDKEEEEEEESDRGVENRMYIKELLITHPIWKDGNYWEQTLWQCAIEQLQAIPYDRAWHDMNKEERKQAVRRVHEVIFSQVMAITHSMLELGCSARQSREFLYRMCVIHQLSEGMRQSLLKHVNAAASTSTRRPSRVALDMRGNALHDDHTHDTDSPFSAVESDTDASTAVSPTSHSSTPSVPVPSAKSEVEKSAQENTAQRRAEKYDSEDVVSV
eukprot:gene9944-11660_t